MWLAFALSAYLCGLILIRPEPASLKALQPSRAESARKILVTLLVGCILIVAFWFTTDGSFWHTNEWRYRLLALNNDSATSALWPLQLPTHLLVHANLLHLLSNVSALALTSLYERRVGHRRFMTVLLVGALASIPSAWFYDSGYYFCGLSGGIFGLGAAYIADHDDMSAKDWLTAIGMFAFIAAAITFAGEAREPVQIGLKTDHVGHILGALGAILYCRLRPQTIPG
jgi:rhomboid protease GluP